MDNVITIKDKDGSLKEAEVLLVFKLEDTNLEYIVYTFNEKDNNNLISIYCSTFVKTDDSYSLEDVKTDAEWNSIKEVMRKVINSNKE